VDVDASVGVALRGERIDGHVQVSICKSLNSPCLMKTKRYLPVFCYVETCVRYVLMHIKLPMLRTRRRLLSIWLTCFASSQPQQHSRTTYLPQKVDGSSSHAKAELKSKSPE
jgi:hypothetical protein